MRILFLLEGSRYDVLPQINRDSIIPMDFTQHGLRY